MEQSWMAETEVIERRPHQPGVDLFQIFGIQVRLDWSWFLIFLLVLWSLSAGYLPQEYPGFERLTYWTTGLMTTILFFLSILIHELSHAMMAIRSGIKVPAITLFVFGGMAHTAEEAKSPKIELSIAIVGPLTSFVLAGLFWTISRMVPEESNPMIAVACDYLAWINLVLGAFNLVPGYPLDGGRVFRALWWWKTGSLVRATRVAADIGKGFAVTLMIIGGLQIFSGIFIGGLWLIFIGMFLRGIAEGSFQELIIRRSLEKIQGRDVMVPHPVTVAPDLSLNRLIDEYLLRYGYDGFPVATNGRIEGIVTLDQVKGFSQEEHRRTTVREVMTPLTPALTIASDDAAAEGLQRMAKGRSDWLVVMENEHMVGMMTSRNFARFLDIQKASTG
ncbi:MAG: peptidase M50 [Nitrospira sp. WS238]|nr:peptidase M50 [Nitrospira sp. WS238]